MDISNCDMCSETEVCVNTKDGSHVCLNRGGCQTADWVPFNHKCYFFRGQETSADENIMFCETMNTKLVRINNAQDKAFLETEMINRGIANMWLAANDRAVEDEWVWGPGDGVLNAVWGVNEPNNAGNEDCAELELNQTVAFWNDLNCALHYSGAVCEDHYKIYL
ncbi:C-type lectin domain family 17, member A-like [Pecten maximus]|uniref:C-type lectin domain family 17, member A-like n=1 Tax=Pecten maximus TaxID=6579 RepID=UPI0014589975|nr:C-type lectin domain family 17, member A-like [Pecten maximus]